MHCGSSGGGIPSKNFPVLSFKYFINYNFLKAISPEVGFSLIREILLPRHLTFLQVFCQPLFAFVEGWFLNKWPNHRTINYECGLPIPLLGLYNVKLFRLCWRTAFVISITGIAILFPLFNQIIGLSAAAKFWPLVVYFPVSMHIEQNKVQQWTVDWILLQAFSFICLLISVASTIASIEGLVKGH